MLLAKVHFDAAPLQRVVIDSEVVQTRGEALESRTSSACILFQKQVTRTRPFSLKLGVVNLNQMASKKSSSTSRSFFLYDYRCNCGKLFFRGALLTCNLEIKCKRCGSITSISGMTGDLPNPDSYALLIDRSAHILSASPSATEILGYTVSELFAMRLCEIDLELHEEIYVRLWDFIRSQSSTFAIDTLQRKKNGESVVAKMSFKFFFT